MLFMIYTRAISVAAPTISIPQSIAMTKTARMFTHNVHPDKLYSAQHMHSNQLLPVPRLHACAVAIAICSCHTPNGPTMNGVEHSLEMFSSLARVAGRDESHRK